MGNLQLECCGSASYADWYEIDWSGSGASQSVPLSCCNHTIAATDCVNTGTDDIYTTVCMITVMNLVMTMVGLMVMFCMITKVFVGEVDCWAEALCPVYTIEQTSSKR